MRILGIGWENLASLERAAEVRLDEAPLGQVGLFAITGPTGAGKTTILDAMCLALFDRTPRLTRGRAPVVGRTAVDEGIAAFDPRNLLRRGAGSGYARCTFEGRDGRVYAATWRARRARNNPGGRLQGVDMELFDVVAGKQLGGTKTEVQAAIVDRLGLDFDQFRRSVLLAQGEFAAFLRAGEKERADLLERVTGTEVYAALGRAAWERAGGADATLEELRAEQRALGLLGEAERRALDEARLEATWRLDQAEWARAEANRSLDLLRRRADLARQCATATKRVEAAEARWAEAEPQRAHLAVLEELAALVPALKEVDRLAAEASALEARRVEQTEGAARAATSLEAADEALQEAVAAWAKERERQTALAPALAAAVALDQEIAAAREALAAAKGDAAAALTAETAASGAVTRVAERIEHQEARRTELVTWLAEHEADGALSRAQESVLHQLDVLIPLVGRLAQLESGRDPLVKALEAAEARYTEVAAQRAAAQSAWANAQKAADEASAAREQAGADRIGVELAAQRTQLLALDRLAELLREVERTVQAAEELAAERSRVTAEQEEAEVAKAAARQAIAAAQGAVEASEAALTRARSALGLEAHRAELVEGEACPLCGSEEHPWGSHAPVFDALVADLGQQVTGARATLAGAREELGRQEARVVALEAQGERLVVQGKALTAALDGSQHGLAAQRERVGLSGDGDVLREAATEARARAEAELARLTAELEAARALGVRAVTAQGAARAALDALDAARRAEEQAQAELGVAREAEAANRRALAEARERRDAAHDAVVVVLGAPLATGADLPALRERLVERARAWEERERERAEADKALAAARVEEGRLKAALEAASRRVQQTREAAAARGVRGDELADQRRQALGGRPTDEVRSELDAALAAVEVRRQRAEASRAERHAALEAARAVLRSTEQRVAAVATARSTADATLAALLAEQALDVGTLRARLDEVARLPELRVELAGLKTTLDAARAVLAAREADRDEALRGLAPRLTGVEAVEVLWTLGGCTLEDDAGRVALDARAEAAVRQLHAALASLEHRARLDDEARAKAEDLTPRLARAEADAGLWQTMRELIGDATGARFKRFAQSLTLDMLLMEANRHLVELNPRYVLERVPNADGRVLLEMQVVDREMGDEVRPVSSLSGGEGFLVSLALALALSSLSSESGTIGSLFIDEGFGTLDADTLEVAIAALEALQHGGRQVGVISHVRGFAEKIGAQVRVVPEGAGLSRVEVAGPGYV